MDPVIDLRHFSRPDASPQQKELLTLISDQLESYIFYGLHPAVDSTIHQASLVYLFDGRAANVVSMFPTEDGLAGLTGERLQVHYAKAGLEEWLPLDRFRAFIRRERELLLRSCGPVIEANIARQGGDL
ncbi:hypothetical protein GCM10011586_29360 [Silvibacterium dinghuense]|nr:hypothetical protein GCM10011586_29360 [Silvibacterium dinghuense]